MRDKQGRFTKEKIEKFKTGSTGFLEYVDDWVLGLKINQTIDLLNSQEDKINELMTLWGEIDTFNSKMAEEFNDYMTAQEIENNLFEKRLKKLENPKTTWTMTGGFKELEYRRPAIAEDIAPKQEQVAQECKHEWIESEDGTELWCRKCKFLSRYHPIKEDK
jgi:hypothetical protein